MIGKYVNRADDWWDSHAPGRRYDRGPMYLCMIIGCFLTSTSMLITGPIPDGSFQLQTNLSVQFFFATCLFVGSAVCLHGSLAGSKYYFPSWLRTTSYRFAISGVPALVASLSFYSATIIRGNFNFLSALGGSIGPLLAIGVMVNGYYFWLETRRIERNKSVIKSDPDGDRPDA